DAQRRPRMSRTEGSVSETGSVMAFVSARTAGEKSGSRPRRIIARRAIPLRSSRFGMGGRLAPPRLSVSEPFAEPSLDLPSPPPVALLQLADQDLPVSRDLLEIVVGELSPALPDPALELAPLPLQGFLVHS